MNTRLALALAVSSLLVYVAGDWSVPVLLHKESEYGFSSGACGLKSKLASVILLSLLPRNRVGYLPTVYGFRMHTTATDVLDTFQPIDLDHDCTYGSMLVGEEESALYNLAMGRRGINSTNVECDSAGQLGCSEIFFRESFDGGHSWSTAVVPPRKDLSDRVHRRGGAILLLEQTKRLFVFYSKVEVQGAASISFITRPPGSRIFTPEAQAVPVTGALQDFAIAVAATVYNLRPLLHLAWVQNAGQLMYASSVSGVDWSKPQSIAKVISMSQYMPPVQLVTLQGNPEVACLAYVDFEENAQLQCFKGMLQTQTAAISFASHVSYVSSAGCQDPHGRDFLVFLARTMDETIRCFLYVVEQQRVTELDPPFKNHFMYEFPQATCEINPKDPDFITIKVVASDHPAQNEYLTTLRAPL